MSEAISSNRIDEGANRVCQAESYQRMRVFAPVTVQPYVRTGRTRTSCCGRASVEPGISSCNGQQSGSCTFTISQVICVRIPVYFGADAETGDLCVNCLGVSNENICAICEES